MAGGGYESNLPGFGGVYSEDDFCSAIAWIKGRWPERQQIHQAEVTANDSAD